LSTGVIAAPNCAAVGVVWLVVVWLWLVDDELAGALGVELLADELLEELPPQPESRISVAASAAVPAIHALGPAPTGPIARL
jgi:hypothetical protein